MRQARPLFKDRKKFHQMADPTLEGRYPIRGLYQVLAIAAMCIQEKPNMRPFIGDIVKALKYLASQPYDSKSPSSRSLKRDSHRKSASEDDHEITVWEDE